MDGPDTINQRQQGNVTVMVRWFAQALLLLSTASLWDPTSYAQKGSHGMESAYKPEEMGTLGHFYDRLILNDVSVR